MQERFGGIPIFEADKEYDGDALRDKLLKRKIFPWICRRKKPRQVAARVESVLKKTRWKVERAISWLQRESSGGWQHAGKEGRVIGRGSWHSA